MSYLTGAASLISTLFGTNNNQDTTGSSTTTADSSSSSSTTKAEISGSQNLTDTLNSVVQSVLGHNVTSTSSNSKTTSSFDPQTLALERDLAASATANYNGTGAISTDSVVGNIFRQAKDSFASVLGEGVNAGVYNDSTRTVLGNDTLARATGDAATAVLGFKQSQGSLAASILDSIAKGTAVTSTDTSGTTTEDSSQTTNTLSHQIMSAVTNMFSASREDNVTKSHTAQQTNSQSNTSGSSGGVSVVCTELMLQGKISRRKWIISMRHFQGYRKDGIEAYYVWAKPVVKYLRANPDGIWAKPITYFFQQRSNYIAGEHSPMGYVCSCILWNLCAVTLYGYLRPLGLVSKLLHTHDSIKGEIQ